MVGSQIGRYEIVQLLGEGGMGSVYLARDPALQRALAIKVLRRDLGGDAVAVQRFLDESRLAAKVEHPNIVKIYDVGQQDDIFYFVMSHVGGGNLEDRLRQGALPLAQALALLTPLAEALDAAHAHGLVHRDIKPSNILLTEDGRPMLVDFGIARSADGLNRTLTGQLIGTPAYMSPEQCEGGHVDWRSDIYSLAVVAYEMLTGRPVFSSTTPMALAIAHVREVPPALPGELRLPPHVQPAFDKALAKDPAARFTSATEFARALAGAVPVELPARRSGAGKALLTVAALLLLICGGALVYQAQQTGSSTPAAPPESPKLAAANGEPASHGESAGQTSTGAGQTTAEPPVAAGVTEGPTRMVEPPTKLEPQPADGVAVPNVVGLTSAKARQLLNQHGLNIGLVRREHRNEPTGLVVEQAPSMGSRLAAGSKVDLRVSAGPAPVAKPKPPRRTKSTERRKPSAPTTQRSNPSTHGPTPSPPPPVTPSPPPPGTSSEHHHRWPRERSSSEGEG